MLRIIIIRKIINIDMMYIIDEEVIKNIILSFRLNIQIFIIIFLFHKSDKKKKNCPKFVRDNYFHERSN
jgi:hypothetical protein